MDSCKRYCITGFVFVSVVGTLAHFFYEWSGDNTIVGLFTPVNESTWEHMKLLFFPAVLYLIFLSLKSGRACPGFLLALSLGILAGTFLIPVIFYTYTGILGYHLAFLDIATFYLCTAAAFFTAWKLSANENLKHSSLLIYYALAVVAVCFLLFTYRPPNLPLFSDPTTAAVYKG